MPQPLLSLCGYTPAVRLSSLRKAVLVLLSAILFGGSGFSGAFASAMQHDLGMELSLEGSPSDDDGRNGSCTHGCAGHLGVHLLAVTQAAQPGVVVVATVERGALAFVQAPPILPDSPFHPPRVFLA
jgi:hypothetical protein